jgi:fatty acid desaturase
MNIQFEVFLISVLAGLFLRVFIIQHDCGHQSFSQIENE